MIKPETSKLEETRRVAEIERRLEAIEKAVGATPDKMVSLQIEMFSCCYNQHVVPPFYAFVGYFKCIEKYTSKVSQSMMAKHFLCQLSHGLLITNYNHNL